MAPYSPQQNGVVERRNQTIIETTRSLLMTVEMSGRFWGEAVMTVVYLLNRSLTRSLNGKTPHEAWYNKKLTVRHLRVFGCIAYMKVARPHLAKLNPRGLKFVFISYEPGSKAYRLYDPAGGERVSQRHLRRKHLQTVERRYRGRPQPKSIHGGVPRHRAAIRRSPS